MTASTRYAVVTGGGSGIGRATCHRLAADGYSVVVVDVAADDADATAAALREAGNASEALVLDVSDGPDVLRQLGKLIERRGAPSAVVNCAGIGVRATVPDTSTDDWDRTLAVNLTGTFHVCRATLPAMIDAGAGNIVNVASAGGIVGIAQRAAYCASKAGVIGLTRSIAIDHARQGIRANAICPGTVATEWIDKILDGVADPTAARRAMEERQLDGRMGTPEEVAAGIAFLVSPDARFVNGSAFVIDGGMTAA